MQSTSETVAAAAARAAISSPSSSDDDQQRLESPTEPPAASASLPANPPPAPPQTVVVSSLASRPTTSGSLIDDSESSVGGGSNDGSKHRQGGGGGAAARAKAAAAAREAAAAFSANRNVDYSALSKKAAKDEAAAATRALQSSMGQRISAGTTATPQGMITGSGGPGSNKWVQQRQATNTTMVNTTASAAAVVARLKSSRSMNSLESMSMSESNHTDHSRGASGVVAAATSKWGRNAVRDRVSLLRGSANAGDVRNGGGAASNSATSGGGAGVAAGGGGGAINSPPSPRTSRNKRASAMTAARVAAAARAAASGSPPPSPPSNARTTLFASKLARRSAAIRTRLGNHQNTVGGVGTMPGENTADLQDVAPNLGRRYALGDYVLVSNHQSHWANPVNRFGFPPGQGDTPEEMRGPYIYVLATVKQIHFEEIKAYYTVTRCDTGADQRADVDVMEPLRNSRGELAALQAATESAPDGPGSAAYGSHYHGEGAMGHQPSKFSDCVQFACYLMIVPFLCLYDCFYFVATDVLLPVWRVFWRITQHHSRLFLNGVDPYVCRIRITAVNFVVLCSAWFMFIDQVRLAFLPATTDTAIASINLVVWVVLVLELLLEVFIRPDGYRSLIRTDKAYSPMTVRYLDGFHLFIESICLVMFIPEFFCVFKKPCGCGCRLPLSLHNALLVGITGSSRYDSLFCHAYLALIRLRVFGLVRHWKNMWITNTYYTRQWRNGTINGRGRRGSGRLGRSMNGRESFKSNRLHLASSHMALPPTSRDRSPMNEKKKMLDSEGRELKKKETTLTNASTIGTGLMVTNSYRALVIMWAIAGLFPLAFSLVVDNRNILTLKSTEQLQATNLVAADTSNDTCAFLTDSIAAWVSSVYSPDVRHGTPYLLTLQIEPYRCSLDHDRLPTSSVCGTSSREGANSTNCPSVMHEYCDFWATTGFGSIADFANATGIRVGSIIRHSLSENGTLVDSENGQARPADFRVVTAFDQSESIALGARASLLLQACLLLMVLGGLFVLRRDAEVYVLGPLRRMLKIVSAYAKNPLSPPKFKSAKRSSIKRRTSDKNYKAKEHSDDDTDDSSAHPDEFGGEDDDLQLGSYETEQLISAVAKITDLLRKCWGVAGADIISTNLASREGALTDVFNPTVPGKSVYALFGFAAIDGFDDALRNLGGDVMILINDVAAVLHDEVFRWGFGDSGQCNKNLGAAFLMVFRIGLVKEVLEKLEQARDVVFSTSATVKNSHALKRRIKQSASGSTSQSSSSNANRHAGVHHVSKGQRSNSVKGMGLSLQSLPGISTFTDRAVIGMLKSFAGIYRDNKIRDWNNDLRLRGGGSFSVSMLYGMDAGWAVEGAVGSEYKIDATYLSPHVNMASRMTGACKQYGVSIMLSQSVQELMSDTARTKLRHLDTVTVKGSSVKQKIYTYDAKAKGVDFFLHSRSEEQADFDADRYTPNIWNTDQDLKAMRQHVTEEFLKEFRDGHKAYIAGDWPTAIRKLERANEVMFETAFEEGYLEDEFDALERRSGKEAEKAAEKLKGENGDGPSLFLLSFMKQHGGKAPDRWEGWHPLTRK